MKNDDFWHFCNTDVIGTLLSTLENLTCTLKMTQKHCFLITVGLCKIINKLWKHKCTRFAQGHLFYPINWKHWFNGIEISGDPNFLAKNGFFRLSHKKL
jgi:hypothetical protein